MSNLKISQLTNGNPAQSGDVIPIDRAGANFSVTVGSIVSLASPAWASLTGDLTETQTIPFDGATPGTPDTGIMRSGGFNIGFGIVITNGTTSAITGGLACAEFIIHAGGADTLHYSPGSNTLGLRAGLTVAWGNSAVSPYVGISGDSAGIISIGNGTDGSTTGYIALTGFYMADFGSAPTSAGTAGTAGQIVYHSGLMYFCSATGAAGAATWNKFSMTAV